MKLLFEYDFSAGDELMDRDDVILRKKLINQLIDEGHQPFAEFIKTNGIQCRYTSDPGVVAYMSAKENVIVINRDKDFVKPIWYSMLVRHEILHFVMEHWARFMKLIGGEDKYFSFNDDVKEFEQDVSNIASDLELSKAYSTVDAFYTKQLGGLFGDVHLKDEFGDKWRDMTMEEIYYYVKNNTEKFKDYIRKRNRQQEKQNSQGDKKHSDEYKKGWQKVIDDYKSGKLTDDMIKNWNGEIPE